MNETFVRVRSLSVSNEHKRTSRRTVHDCSLNVRFVYSPSYKDWLYTKQSGIVNER
ncbi:hypothetical protein HanRHA438_Chr15g0722641 [Helianthus annuus]|nr:hypothetical protein HanRHA438_Chr15g0722641 [Helianthus annuus]